MTFWRGVGQALVYGRGYFHGILLGDWLRILKENRFRVSLSYVLPVIIITISSLLNTVLHWVEVFRFGAGIQKTQARPPVFILGIWRSGTSHLHNLMAQDDRFTYPNYIQVMNPHTFLTMEPMLARAVDSVAPTTRGIDNMPSGSKFPEEDEYALLILTRLSYQLWGPFPRLGKTYSRYLTFRNASTEEVARWKRGLRFFVQKMFFKSPRPLLLKSPAHTGRIRLILDVFPDAKFVYIHRNPYEVFQSYMHMVNKSAAVFNAHAQASDHLTAHTLWVVKELSDAFYDERDLIPKGQYCQVSYESLTLDPMEQIRLIYERLSLPDFKVAEPAFRQYLDSIADYKKNNLKEMSPELRARVAKEWHRIFKEGGYAE